MVKVYLKLSPPWYYHGPTMVWALLECSNKVPRPGDLLEFKVLEEDDDSSCIEIIKRKINGEILAQVKKTYLIFFILLLKILGNARLWMLLEFDFSLKINVVYISMFCVNPYLYFSILTCFWHYNQLKELNLLYVFCFVL